MGYALGVEDLIEITSSEGKKMAKTKKKRAQASRAKTKKTKGKPKSAKATARIKAKILTGSHAWAQPEELDTLELQVYSAFDPCVKVTDKVLSALIKEHQGQSWFAVAIRRTDQGLLTDGVLEPGPGAVLFTIRSMAQTEGDAALLAGTGNDTTANYEACLAAFDMVATVTGGREGERLRPPGHVRAEIGMLIRGLTQARGLDAADLGNLLAS